MIPPIKINRNILVFIVIFILSLSFAIYTKHAWEDWYITYRCSKNLALGNGLVYTAGQRVYAFTSPIGTLIPAVLNVITFNSSDELVLWLFRVMGCLLLGLSAVLLVRISKESSLCTLPTLFLICMFGTNINIVDFSTNGMEPAFMVFFLTCIIYFMALPCRYPSLSLGLAWAGLMWTRPDSFIYIGGLSLGYFLFNPTLPNVNSRKELVRVYMKDMVVSTLLYLPWIIWTWYYYGSPIPHTIIAKSIFTIIKLTRTPFMLHYWSLTRSFVLKSFYSTFMPPYFFYGGWNNLASNYSNPLALVCAFYWILPFARSQGRAISFAAMITHIYLTFLTNMAPWYIPSVTFLSIFVLAQIIQQIMTIKTISYTLACTVLLINLFLTLGASYQLRLQQEIIENGNRKQIGLWLKKNAATSKDSVFLEPLGYIGFFSQLKMYDWSGLASPEVVAIRKKVKSNVPFAELIAKLHPDWLVLRPFEIKEIQDKAPTLLTVHYQPVKVFDVSKIIQSYSFMPGRSYLNYDQTFTVFKKRND